MFSGLPKQKEKHSVTEWKQLSATQCYSHPINSPEWVESPEDVVTAGSQTVMTYKERLQRLQKIVHE
ncbi:MAG: hypothetical protein ACLFTJ_13790 [Halothece sp.]